MKQVVRFLGLALLVSFVQSEYEDICGIENPSGSLSGRVIGGQEASPNQFPWTVALTIHFMRGNGTCTGSIINKQWILTAGHCVGDSQKIEVYVGSHDYELEDEPHRQYFVTEESYLHPNYDYTEVDDIALVKLQEEIEFNDYVRPACFPTYSDVGKTFSDERVTVIGWGRIKGEPDPISVTALQYAEDIKVIDNKACKDVYGSIVTERLICIDSSEGRGVCSGDSGGPLNYEMEPGKYMQIGVADFVSTLSCIDKRPEGYARLTEYLEWIEKMTGRLIES
uniref:Chymotrypsin-C n=1 Tax=Caligus rogercresseyi TaxID=217165 RepID=C1BME3_CALRO|nr:Chymotrypsin-C precursor [Caligus rogercresseyi]